MYRILSIDGGGVRGILPVVLLQRLCAHPALHHTDWLARTKLITGTSTGGLIALGLAHGVSLAQLRALYEHDTRKIFADSRLDNLRDLGSLRGAQYSGVQLLRIVKALAGDVRLGELKTRVIIPAFDLDNEHTEARRRTWKPKLFHNIPGEDAKDRDLPAYRVALYTTAGPTYFPSVDGYVDGGVFANDPSMCALIQTQDARNAPSDRPALRDVALLSLGTGRANQFLPQKTMDWGRLQWASYIPKAMTDAHMKIVEYQCRQLIGPRYYRVQPALPQDNPIALDAVRRMSELVSLAEAIDIEPIVQWLRQHWLT